MKNIGCFLKECRELKNYSQQDLADKLYVTKQAVSFWELGKRDLSLQMLNKLSGILDFKITIKDGVTSMEQNNGELKIRLEKFDLKYVDVERNLGEYSIIKLYAPIIEGRDEYDLEDVLYDNKKELVNEYPNYEIQTVYTLINNETGIIPMSYYSYSPKVDLLLDYYYTHLAPVLTTTKNNINIYDVVDTNAYLVKTRSSIKLLDNGNIIFIPLDVGNFTHTDLLEDNTDCIENTFAIVDINGNLYYDFQFAYPYYFITKIYETFIASKRLYDNFYNFNNIFCKYNTDKFESLSDIIKTYFKSSNDVIETYNEFRNGTIFELPQWEIINAKDKVFKINVDMFFKIKNKR